MLQTLLLYGGVIVKEKVINPNKKKLSLGSEIKRDFILYLMAIPVIVYFFLFCYLPMFGLVIAFQDFKPALGVMGSKFVGFKHFLKFFSSPLFWPIIKNTVLISFYDIVFHFPAPIIFALMLNEIKNTGFKRIIQTITYLPHFISTVVICSMIIRFLDQDGIITAFLSIFTGEKTNYLLEPGAFRTIYIGSGIWQGLGWGSIIYISALSSIDQELYEAAVIDGAGKWKQTIHITLPGILSTIVVLFIMRLGSVLSVGYEKILLLQNSYTRSISRVISVYVYERGIGEGNDMSFASAVGLFTSLVNIAFLFLSNFVSKKVTDSGLF